MLSRLPGNTDLSSYTKSEPPLQPLQLNAARPVIILATNEVNDETLFRNGLTQNIVVLYDLFECMGYKSYLLQYNGATNTTEKKPFILNYRTITPGEIIRNPMPIKLFIEIGMSLDAVTRRFLRSNGAKIVKLYLGNILNIDIETIQNCRNAFFNHHIVGEIDEVWTSPHYKQHVDYAAVINRTDISKGRVVPYVWDSCFITQYGTKELIEWKPPSTWQAQDIVIMDPNISFQKCYFYSLLLVEAFSKKYPEWRGKVHVINGDRLKLIPQAYNFILPSLSIYKDDRVILHSRKSIHTIFKDHPNACFITHQWNNDFNYMTLELLYCNYPILHNSDGWSNFGYHYSINEWNKAIDTLYSAIKDHKETLQIYKTHAANLIWKHSIHNPEIQREWATFL